MAKKKKTQLKAAPRGFTTVSVPKKVAPVEAQSLSESLESDRERTTADPQAASDNIPVSEAGPAVESEESQNLQKFVEKEITRTIKAIEVDRRYTSTLPTLELQPILVERVLSLASDSDVIDGKKKIVDAEEKMLARLGITYGVLRRLGFSETRVNECLRAIQGVELDEAYDWLYAHCSDTELDYAYNDLSDTPSEPITPKGLNIRSSTTSSTARFTSNVDLLSSSHASVRITSSFQEPLEAKSELEISNSGTTTPLDSDSADDDHPNMQYVRLKIQLDDIMGTPSADRISNTQKLRNRLDIVKKNLFFDELEAETLYQLERKKLLSLPAHVQVQSENRKRSKKLPPNIVPQPMQQSVQAENDIFEEDNDIGLFDILEPIPSEVTTEGTVVRIRDMSLPKHWSGRTPKVLLSETVAKLDRYAATPNYVMVSGASRAKRASVIIRWSRKSQEWTMEDVACYDDGQAEQYVATVALHALTHAQTEGFAIINSGASGIQTFFRMLPTVFRDLWDELEDARKLRDEGINRVIWNNLRSILQEKQDSIARLNNKATKQLPNSGGMHASMFSSQVGTPSVEQLVNAFNSRVASENYQEMLVHRNSLPIAKYREEIMGILNHSQVLVLSGETGCGKSTQVPTFILEDQLKKGKPCKIYCTEPRRISAISLAQRVSRELGEPPSALGTMNSLVGYSIRLANETSKNTRLTFVTNGIALRMLEGGGLGDQGVAFDEITHIIVDEVHERTIESDFLLIVLKSLLEQRADLKVILMSATVDAEKFAQYFGGCPTLHVPGRTFPVEVQYLEDAVEYTQWVISEDSPYARREHDKFYNSKNKVDWSEDLTVPDDDDLETTIPNLKLEKRYSSSTTATINLLDERLVPYDLIVRLLEKLCFEDVSYQPFSAAILIFMPGLGEIRRLNDLLIEHPRFGTDEFRVHPLHSTISSENQGAVFDIPPQGTRKLVIATNIAETGITIPDITCVIDSGKHREMRFDEKRQISRLVETFVAKSNAAQRRGRAGRVQPGLCFHLFTKYRHDVQMIDNPLPEMLRLSLADLALRIKIMKIKLGSSIEDTLSRALDPPSAVNVQRAISMLVEVRALTTAEEMTPLGRKLAAIPTDVHLGKFLLIATIFHCLDPALTIVATLNSKSPFITPFGLEQEADRAKISFRIDNSDFLTVHNAFSMWRRASTNAGSAKKFCRANFLSHQNLQQIEELRQQLLGYLIDSSSVKVDKSFVRELAKARYGRNRNRFITVPPELDNNSGNHALMNAALAAGLYPKVLAIDSAGLMRTISNNQNVSFHPTSVNFGRKAADIGAHHLAYFTLMHSKKLYAWETGPVDDLALALLCGEPEFKLISEGIFIDRKVRYRIAPRSALALKYLRAQLSSLLAQRFRSKPLLENQQLWHELAMLVLSKTKVEEMDEAKQ